MTNYRRDKEAIENFFAQIENIPNLIIDLRENSGGSDLYWQDLIVKPNAKEDLNSERIFLFNQTDLTARYIRAQGADVREESALPRPLREKYRGVFTHYTADKEVFERAENPYKGKIWVLTDDTVYSAAENFAKTPASPP